MMNSSSVDIKSFILGGTIVGTLALGLRLIFRKEDNRYSIPNQPERFALAKQQQNTRVLNIDGIYDPSYVRGKVVLVTGGNRGLGLAMSQELITRGALVYVTSRAPFVLKGAAGVFTGVDVQNDSCGEVVVKGLKGQHVDILINNAGYFYEPEETLASMNFKEEMKV
jgi:hypothetical protein